MISTLPLDISMVDSSISLLSRIFPKATKFQLEVTQIFADSSKIT